MLLHAETTGKGSETVVLLHGMTGSAESWWRVTGLLADRGVRVVAIDLPGHGHSPRSQAMTLPGAAASVAETLDAMDIRPTVTVGHSFGGLLLAAAVATGRLDPGVAVFVDAPFASRGGHDRVAVQAEYQADRASRTVDRLRAEKPHYGERDCQVEARAASRFDPATAAAIAAGPGGTWLPRPGSIVVRADPSHYVDDATAAALTASGVDVRSIPGAAHSVWYSHFDPFVAALPEVFDR
ncbi:pimeloyl-ACP methyl ester carboxylesterase [Curtobacterium herbarum]|uniref:alpha/beta hydrolase n=1 Tax=Curtobacterium herbarum TaxID=150122 RepID=UPI0020A05912|nr:alpha/beta hydrolase family protein [Curtobacterium herbarum]MCP1501777.1 pimeloyl-ACP methyl ester carboxylesterase [Curtobacterium herbarum]